MQSTSPKRPQKCMLSGQLEARRRKAKHEGVNKTFQNHSGALPHGQGLARLTASEGKSGGDINYAQFNYT